MAGTKAFDVEAARQSALGVFWQQGYANTSLDDLTEAMGISRSSFYNAFGSKHALFLEVLGLYRSIVVTELRRELSGPAKAAISRMMDKVLGVTGATASDDRRGCLLGNTALELAQSDPEAAERTRAGLSALDGIFEVALTRGIESGELDPDRSPREWARFLTASIQGAMVLAKSGASARQVRQVLNIALDALD